MEMRVFLHSCGGWYTAAEDKEGSHRAPPSCSCDCYPTRREALRAARQLRELIAEQDQEEDE